MKMTTQDLDVELEFSTRGAVERAIHDVEKVLYDVEQVFHDTDRPISHGPLLGIFGIISIFSVLLLLYRITGG